MLELLLGKNSCLMEKNPCIIMDYEILKKAWIRQSYELLTDNKNFGNKARDGNYYTFFPPLEYIDWKNRLFSNVDVKALISKAIDESSQKIKQFVKDNKNIIPNSKYSSLHEPINNVSFILQRFFGIDEVAVGGGVVDQLREEGYKIKGMNGGRRPTKRNNLYFFANLKSQMYWDLREAIQLGKLKIDLKHNALINDLLAVKWEIRGDRVIKIESKEEIKNWMRI